MAVGGARDALELRYSQDVTAVQSAASAPQRSAGHVGMVEDA